MGDREPVHFNNFKSYNNSSETTLSAITLYIKSKKVSHVAEMFNFTA